MSIEIQNLLHALNLDRPDIAELPEGATLACNVTTLRKIGTYLLSRINDQPVDRTSFREALSEAYWRHSPESIKALAMLLSPNEPERESISLNSDDKNDAIRWLTETFMKINPPLQWEHAKMLAADGLQIMLSRFDIRRRG